jgi:uncharacterized membrane protein YfcA
MVPLMVLWAGQTQRRSAAISLGAIIPISIVSIAAYAIAGKIHVTAAIALTIGAVIGARLGAELLSRLPERALKALFGCFLLVASALMIAKA